MRQRVRRSRGRRGDAYAPGPMGPSRAAPPGAGDIVGRVASDATAAPSHRDVRAARRESRQRIGMCPGCPAIVRTPFRRGFTAHSPGRHSAVRGAGEPVFPRSHDPPAWTFRVAAAMFIVHTGGSSTLSAGQGRGVGRALPGWAGVAACPVARPRRRHARAFRRSATRPSRGLPRSARRSATRRAAPDPRCGRGASGPSRPPSPPPAGGRW